LLGVYIPELLPG
jgi:hypothetical protein